MGQSAAVTALKMVVRKEGRGGGSPFESSVASAGNQGTGVAVCAEVAFAACSVASVDGTQTHTGTRAHVEGEGRGGGGLSDQSDSATGKIGEQGGLEVLRQAAVGTVVTSGTVTDWGGKHTHTLTGIS